MRKSSANNTPARHGRASGESASAVGFSTAASGLTTTCRSNDAIDAKRERFRSEQTRLLELLRRHQRRASRCAPSAAAGADPQHQRGGLLLRDAPDLSSLSRDARRLRARSARFWLLRTRRPRLFLRSLQTGHPRSGRTDRQTRRRDRALAQQRIRRARRARTPGFVPLADADLAERL